MKLQNEFMHKYNPSKKKNQKSLNFDPQTLSYLEGSAKKFFAAVNANQITFDDDYLKSKQHIESG